MRLFVTGATGFVGQALVERAQTLGWEVTASVRRPEAAARTLGQGVHLVPADAEPAALRTALRAADAVVNLAGEPIMGGRWTAPRRAALRASRVDLTAALVAAIDPSVAPAAFVSASAVGIYGDGGDAALTEASPPGRLSSGGRFLSELCQAWEAAARGAEAHGVRVVTPRIGVVLGSGGGALARLRPLFAAGLGGPIGGGQQWMPWIQVDDLIALLLRAVEDPSLHGPLNAVAPGAVRQRDFARALGRAMGRPSRLPTPAFALKAAFGQAATVLLEGQHAVPERALDAGFRFAFPELDAALAHTLGAGRSGA